MAERGMTREQALDAATALYPAEMAGLDHPWLNGILWGGRNASSPDTAAKALADEGRIRDGYVDTLWEAIRADVETVQRAKARQLDQAYRETASALESGKRAIAERTAAIRAETAERTATGRLSIGTGLTPEARAQMEAVRKRLEGTAAWMKAPNGKPTRLTRRLWLLVRTPAFKAWFGDWENDSANASKVVDANGEPLVVYHGRFARFTVFDDRREGVKNSTAPYGTAWFASNRNTAANAGAPGLDPLACFLNLRNPLVVDARGHDWDNLPEGESTDYLAQDAIDFYRDGLIVRNVIEGDGTLTDDYVVLTDKGGAANIKSATENTGSFDPADPDIRRAVGGYRDGFWSERANDALLRGLRTEAQIAQTLGIPYGAWMAHRPLGPLGESKILGVRDENGRDLFSHDLLDLTHEWHHVGRHFDEVLFLDPDDFPDVRTPADIADRHTAALFFYYTGMRQAPREANTDKLTKDERNGTFLPAEQTIARHFEETVAPARNAFVRAIAADADTETLRALAAPYAEAMSQHKRMADATTKAALTAIGKPRAYRNERPRTIAGLRYSVSGNARQPIAIPSDYLTAKDVYEELKRQLGTTYVNRETGERATLNMRQIRKVLSNKATDKSIANGFTISQHNQAARRIGELYENATLAEEHADANNDPNVVAIRRYASPISVSDGSTTRPATAWLTIKVSEQNGSRIYSLELLEIEEPGAMGRGNALASNQQRGTPDSKNTVPYPGGNVNPRRSVGGWLEEATEAHREAERKGDVETARRLVEEAAERAGYTIRATHGAPVFGFTVFDPNVSDDGRSLFFAGDVGTAGSYSGVGGIREIHTREGYHALLRRILDASRYQGVVDAFEESDVAEAKYVALDEDEAEDYGDEGYYELSFKADDEVIARVPLSVLDRTTDWDFEDLSVGKILNSFPEEAAGNYAVALRMERPLVIDAQGNRWDHLRFTDEEEGEVGGTTREIAKYAKQHGYDGVIIQNVHDVGGKAPQFAPDLDTVYIVFAPRQVKSLDPFSYDGDGNLIPLAQRFDPRPPDIRRSVGGVDPEATPARQKEARGAYPDLGEEIATARFAVGAKRKAEYRALIAKARPNLPQGDVDAFMRELDTLDDTKKEKAALHWFVKGSLILPEDRDKLDMATQMAGKYHLDFQTFDSPAALINEANARAEAKKKKPAIAYLDPDTVPQLSNKRDLGHGVVIYDVEDSPAGQQAMRQIMNSHLGRNANGAFWSPWCLLTCSPTTGALSESARKYWARYGKTGRAAAFHNGKLCAFQSSDTKRRKWWDLDDKDHGTKIPLPLTITAKEMGYASGDIPGDIVIQNAYEMTQDGKLVPLAKPKGRAFLVGTRGSIAEGKTERWIFAQRRVFKAETSLYKNGVRYKSVETRYPAYEIIRFYAEGNQAEAHPSYPGSPYYDRTIKDSNGLTLREDRRLTEEEANQNPFDNPNWRSDMMTPRTGDRRTEYNGGTDWTYEEFENGKRIFYAEYRDVNGRGRPHGRTEYIDEDTGALVTEYYDHGEQVDHPVVNERIVPGQGTPRRSIIGAVGASNLHNAGYRLTEDARGRRILTKAPNATRTLLQGLNEAAEEVRNLVGTDFTRGERARATRLTHYSPTDRDNVALAGRWRRHQADRDNPTDAYALASKHWGWTLGKDGKWRLEIPYGTLRKGARARLVNKAKENGNEERDAIPLGELINDEPLFAAYPGLANTPIYALKSPRGNTTQGYARLGRIAIYPTKHKTDKELTDTLYHEIQHIIQGKENFENGASATTDWSTYANAIGEAEARVAGLHATLPQLDSLDVFFSTPSRMTEGNIKGKDGQWRRQTYDDLTFSHQRLAASQRDYLRDVRLFTKIADAKTLPALMSLVKTRLNIVNSEFYQQPEGDTFFSAYIEYRDGDTFIDTFADEASALRTLKRVFIHRIARQPRRAVGGSARRPLIEAKDATSRADALARALLPVGDENRIDARQIIIVADVPNWMKAYGFDGEGIAINGKILKKLHKKHAFTPETFAHLVEALGSPVLAMRDKQPLTDIPMLTVLTDVPAPDMNGRIAPIMASFIRNGTLVDIASAYSRTENAEKKYANAVKDGTVLFADKARAAKNPLLARALSLLNSFNGPSGPNTDTVAYPGAEVKPQNRAAVGGADERLRAVNARVRTAALYYGRSPAEADIAQRAIVEVALFAEASRTGKTLKPDDIRRAYADFGIETDDRHAATIADRINDQARQERYTPRKKGNASITPRDIILQQQERLRQAYDIHWTQAQKDAFAQGVAGAFGASRNLARDAMEVAKTKRDEAEAVLGLDPAISAATSAPTVTNSRPCSPTTAPSPSTKTRPKPSSASPSTTAPPESSTMRLRGWGERRSGGLGGETLRGLTRNP